MTGWSHNKLRSSLFPAEQPTESLATVHVFLRWETMKEIYLWSSYMKKSQQTVLSLIHQIWKPLENVSQFFFFFISKSECFNHNSIFRVPKTVTHQPQWAHRDVLSLRWPLWPRRPTKPLCTIPPKKEMLACPHFAHLSTANKWSCTHSTLQWWREIEQEIEK